MNVVKIKIYCAKCDCMVVAEGHARRCRPKSVKGWSDNRRAAWVGDSVHRMDVQLAVRMLGVPPECWEIEAQKYTCNAAQAAYLFSTEEGSKLAVELRGNSTHYVGTEFEARYSGGFRAVYLFKTFPAVAERVVAVWSPPPLVETSAGSDSVLLVSSSFAGGGVWTDEIPWESG